MVFLNSSCNTTEINQEEKFINDVLFSIITDNPDIFTSDCKLLNKMSNRFMPPSINYGNDSTFIESIKEFFDEDEFDNLLRQKRNLEKYEFNTKQFHNKYEIVSEAKIDSLLERTNADNNLNYWSEFQNEIGCLQVFSRPIISANKKTAIIRQMGLRGPHAAGGFIIIFQLKNGKWTVKEDIESWVG